MYYKISFILLMLTTVLSYYHPSAVQPFVQLSQQTINEHTKSDKQSTSEQPKASTLDKPTDKHAKSDKHAATATSNTASSKAQSTSETTTSKAQSTSETTKNKPQSATATSVTKPKPSNGFGIKGHDLVAFTNASYIYNNTKSNADAEENRLKEKYAAIERQYYDGDTAVRAKYETVFDIHDAYSTEYDNNDVISAWRWTTWLDPVVDILDQAKLVKINNWYGIHSNYAGELANIQVGDIVELRQSGSSSYWRCYKRHVNTKGWTEPDTYASLAGTSSFIEFQTCTHGGTLHIYFNRI